MKTLKRMFAGLVSLIMVLSLISVMPVMATGEETETETIEFADIFEKARYETNLIPESGASFDTSEDGTIPNGWWNGGGTLEVSSDQSYFKNKSALHIYSGSTNYWYRPISGTQPKKTYIATAMLLGTEKNASVESIYTNKDTQWSKRYGMGAVSTSNVDVISDYKLFPQICDTLTASPSDATERIRSEKDEWKRTSMVFTTKPDVTPSVSISITPWTGGIEFYSDDYYCAELMVADVQCTTPTTVNVSKLGTTEVELKATAYNQIATTDGLTDAKYNWELITPVDGVSIEGNKLLVTDEAKSCNITVRVTCEPDFLGADVQEEKYTKYRSKDIAFKIVDYFETLRKTTNRIAEERSPGVESANLWGSDAYSDRAYYTPVGSRSNTYEISVDQAYNGNQSMLMKRPSTNTFTNEAHFPTYASIKRDTAYVFSAMVLGTRANASTCETNAEAMAEMKPGTWGDGGAYYNILNKSYADYLGENPVKLNTMLEAPASGTAGKVAKDKWKMVHAAAVIPKSYPGNRYWLSGGVVVDTNDVELYVDDYYISELTVAKVKGTTEKAYITSEENTVELTAETYNQLGTTDYFGENTSYTWTAESLPEGVELVDGKLVIAPTAEEGQAVLTVTVDPDFAGDDTQTSAEQLARRTATVTVDIVDQTRFTFAEADGKITATAVAGELDKNAKIYCAIYKVEKDVETEEEILKLMDVEVKDLVPDGENVAFTAIDKPDYDYVIKCFMVDISKLVAIIPAASK